MTSRAVGLFFNGGWPKNFVMAFFTFFNAVGGMAGGGVTSEMLVSSSFGGASFFLNGGILSFGRTTEVVLISSSCLCSLLCQF